MAKEGGSAEELIARIYRSYLAAKQGAKGDVRRDPSLSAPIIDRVYKENPTPTVLVTGSRGKGSVAMMLAAMLGQKKRIGLFTGPHVYRFHERIRVDGREIPDEALRKHLKKAVDLLSPVEASLAIGQYISPMAYQTIAALSYFASCGTDINIMECGKGVRYDDVAAVPHPYAVINCIMGEHIPELGANEREIAEDKATVMHGAGVCFCAAQRTDVTEVLQKAARRYDCSIEWIEGDHKARVVKEIEPICLHGFLKDNAALAYVAAKRIDPALSAEDIRAALSALRIPGRMEVIVQRPYVLFDACMTRESAREMRAFLLAEGRKDVTVILGLSDDKDICGVAEEMQEVAARFIITDAHNPHYLCTDDRLLRLQRWGIVATHYGNVNDAINEARRDAKDIVILGLLALRKEMKET